MPQKLDVQKAIQAVGVLLRREGKKAGRLRLLKLLYIADRQSLRETGFPILASRVVAMKHGPVHSEVLDLINGNHSAEPIWSRYFRAAGRDVVLSEEPEVGELSRQEIERLNKVVDLHAHLGDWEVADITHGFREWVEKYPDPSEDTSREIPIELMIDAVERSGDKGSILQDLKDSEAFDRFFQAAT